MVQPTEWPFSDLVLGAWLAVGAVFCIYNFFSGLILRQSWLSAIILPGALFLLIEYIYFSQFPTPLLFGLDKSMLLSYLGCIIVPLTIIATAGFTRKFLRLRHLLPHIDHALKYIGYWSAVPLIGLPFLPVAWVSMAIFSVVCLGAVLATYAHWHIWQTGGLNMRLLGGSWLLMGPALIAWFGRNLGVFDGTPVVVSIYLLGFSGNLIILSIASLAELRALNEKVITSLRGSRKLEQQLRNEVKERTKTLDAEKARANAEYESKRAFVSLISHDLRGPLANASQALERIVESKNALPELTQQRLLERVNETIRRQISLVDRVLDLESLNSRSTSGQSYGVDFKKIAEERIKAWQGSANDQGISVLIDRLHDRLLYGDATLISALLDHLVANAIRHTPRGGQIRVYQHPYENNSFTVSNFVQTLSDENRARIEDAVAGKKALNPASDDFYQSHDALVDPGSGRSIGIRLARALIIAHGGELTCTIEEDWVNFTIQLPEVRPLILLVDDQALQIKDLRERIIALELSCELAQAQRVDDALEQISQRPPALVISDIKMPKKDGFALLERIRKNNRWEEVRVALTSAAESSEQSKSFENQSMRLGADAYFDKPIKEAELRALIRGLHGIRPE